MPASSRPARAQHRRARPALTSSTILSVLGAALIYAVLHWALTALPLTLPLAGRWYLALRPGALVPVVAGLLAGPLGGLLVGLLGRLAGDLLAVAGLNGVGLIYSGLLGLIAGLGWQRQRPAYATLRPQLWAALWGLLAAGLAGLGTTLVVETLLLGQFSTANGWDRAVSEALSGAVSVLLLLPGTLFIAGKLGPRPSSSGPV
jgi:hypothetical protein